MNRWLKILLAIIVVAAVAYVPYMVEHNKNSDLQKQVNSLKSDLGQAKQQDISATTPTTTPTTSSVGTSYMSKNGVRVVVFSPKSNATVSSPVAVVGEVPGNWSSEAQFPITLKDSAGNEVASGTAQLLGDWMTTSLVPFSAKLTYTAIPSGKGTLVLQKDNPSGIASKDDSVSIPIHF